MNLKDTHAEMGPLSMITDRSLGEVLREALNPTGNADDLVRSFLRDRREIRRLMDLEPLPEVEGKVILSMSPADVRGLSQMRATHRIEEAVVIALDDGGSSYFWGDVLGIGEWEWRRIKHRAKRGGSGGRGRLADPDHTGDPPSQGPSLRHTEPEDSIGQSGQGDAQSDGEPDA